MTFAEADDASVRDDHVGAGRRRRGGRRARAPPRTSATSSLPTSAARASIRAWSPAAERSSCTRERSRACPCKRRGSTFARSVPAAARSRTSTSAACSRSVPRSAGALPGPACYGRGGELPTVTDAAFFLGMLGEGTARERDQPRPRAGACRARAARRSASASPRKRSRAGIMTIAAANMANAIREITIEQGRIRARRG